MDFDAPDILKTLVLAHQPLAELKALQSGWTQAQTRQDLLTSNSLVAMF